MKKLISLLLIVLMILSVFAVVPFTVMAVQKDVSQIRATSSNWSWPTSIHNMKSDWPNYSSGSYHGGTDFPVALNSPVYSTCDGEVVAVTSLTTSYGKHIKIRATVNGSTVYMRYCHLNTFAVKVGDKVLSGQLIGYSGSTGNSTGPHLHYEVRNANDYYGNSSSPNLNPKYYLPGTSYTFESHATVNNPDGISSFGYDYPTEGQNVTDREFRFQGWVVATKDIYSITCSINDGETYVSASLYTREDVPSATAFLVDIPTSYLTVGTNKVAVCVNYTDGTGVVVDCRTVNRTRPTVICALDYPSNGQEIYDTKFLFQGWVEADKNIKTITCSINDGQRYITAGLYTREDVPYATAYRVSISSDYLEWGTNKISTCVTYTDGTAVTAATHTVYKKYAYALEYPSAGEIIDEETFLFQGWVLSEKNISKIQCLVNRENYIDATMYTREDVPDAVAFRRPLYTYLLDKYENTISIVVTYSDGTQVTLNTRKVYNKQYEEATDPTEHDHSWDEGVVTSEPTCTENGVKTHTCTCGESYTETVTATGHTEVIDEAVDATCISSGFTVGSHCSVCKEILIKQEVIPATGHTQVVDEAVASSCTQTGLTEGEHCSECGKILVAQKIVSENGHKVVVDEAVPPTLTETGLTEGKHCSVCGEVLVAQEVLQPIVVPTSTPTTEPTEKTTQQPTQGPTVAPTNTPVKIGDVDEDGIVNIFDATKIQLYIAKYATLSDTQMIAADADKDGIVNIFDVTRIQLYLAKYITEF